MKADWNQPLPMRLLAFVFALAGLLGGCRQDTRSIDLPTVGAQSNLAPHPGAPWIQVLGIGQDAGVPQAGAHAHPGWNDPELQRMATSLGLAHPGTGARWIFEATPDFRRQWYDFDTQSPLPLAGAPDGIFLTHGHMGHYTGLMFLGHESMGADGVPVYALPRMAEFLSSNGPWSQLVQYQNIELHVLTPDLPILLADGLAVTAFTVPHRQEFTEVAGYRIEGPSRSALFIPDIDSWEEWDSLGTRIEDLIAQVDIAFLDATFFGDGEIPGRDMSGFPHPFISHSMDRFGVLPESERSKIHFIHLNHTNPALDAMSDEHAAVLRAGYHVATRGDRFEL